MIKTTLAALLAALGLAACGKSGPSVDPMLEPLAALHDRMCACADAKCASDVWHDFKKWDDSDQSPDIDHPQRQHLSKEVIDGYEKLDKELEDCRDKLR